MRIFPTFHFCGSRSRDSCAYDFAVGIYRPEKHGMRGMKPAIHPNRVGSIEAGGESAQAFGSAPDQSIVLLGYLHNPHRFDEFGHVQQRRLMLRVVGCLPSGEDRRGTSKPRGQASYKPQATVLKIKPFLVLDDEPSRPTVCPL